MQSGKMKQLDSAEQRRINFANRLNALLDKANFSPKYKGRQIELSKLFNVSQEAARKWLEGETMPRHAMITSIAAKFGVETTWLENGIGEMFPDPTTDQLLSYWNQLDDEEKDAALKLLRSLASK